MEIAVLGNRNFTLGFQLSGIRNTRIIQDNNLSEQFEECFNAAETGIIIIEEQYFQNLPKYIKKKVENTVIPVIVTLSDDEAAASDIGNLIKRSLGVDLWRK